MNPAECPHTLYDLESCKDISMDKVLRDYSNLCDFPATTNPRKFAGNPTLYYYQHRVSLNCYREGGMTLKTIFDSNEEIQKLWNETIKRNMRDKDPLCSATDMFECYRINRGSIVFFKASTSKYLYKRFNATSVLDPTAGWGGRMLGAMSLGIKYTGIDTNINLKEGYDRMLSELPCNNREDYKMIWDSCLNVDYSKIDYDFVLTSPPYVNLELYEGMTPFQSNEIFYNEFLIPMMNRVYEGLSPGGFMCINISPKMFRALNYPAPDFQVDLRQQLGKQFKSKSQDSIYVWEKPAE